MPSYVSYLIISTFTVVSMPSSIQPSSQATITSSYVNYLSFPPSTDANPPIFKSPRSNTRKPIGNPTPKVDKLCHLISSSEGTSDKASQPPTTINPLPPPPSISTPYNSLNYEKESTPPSSSFNKLSPVLLLVIVIFAVVFFVVHTLYETYTNVVLFVVHFWKSNTS